MKPLKSLVLNRRRGKHNSLEVAIVKPLKSLVLNRRRDKSNSLVEASGTRGPGSTELRRSEPDHAAPFAVAERGGALCAFPETRRPVRLSAALAALTLVAELTELAA
jgi:hypothetical protein